MARPRKPSADDIVEKRMKKVCSDEDWIPTDDGEVEVTLYRWRSGEMRVCVWGGDDFGLEKNYPSGCDRLKVRAEFNRVVDGVTQAELRSRGYEIA